MIKFFLNRSFRLNFNSDRAVITLLILASLLLFTKTFLQGLYPFPGNLLVSFFYPWFSGGWEGYDSWTVHKAFLSSDALRQMIPWRHLAIDLFKQGQLPLWNPYSFTGTPLLANLQTAAFYPGNIIFFVLPFFWAWNFYIIIQPVALMLSLYLLLRHWKISPLAALIPSFSWATTSFSLGWLESGIIGHTLIWLPLIILAIDKLHHRLQARYICLLLFATTTAFTAGHIQSFLFSIIAICLYWLTLTRTNTLKHHPFTWLSGLILWLTTTFGLVTFQLLPALELHHLSPLTKGFAYQVFLDLPTPIKNLLTVFAPDFFGHPGTYNLWTDIYGDGTPFIGIITLFFAIYSIKLVKNWRVLFFLTLTLITLTYIFPGPLYHLAAFTHAPIFSQTLTARAMFIPIFSLTVAAAFGIDHFLNRQSSRWFWVLIFIFSLVYLTLLGVTFLGPKLTSLTPELTTNFHTSFRNLILPIFVFASLPVASLVFSKFLPRPTLFILAIFIPTTLFAIYRTQKTLPFSPAKFFYPGHLAIDQLNTYGIDRFAGRDSAHIETNLSVYYRLFSAEGYDSLRIDRFAELMASQETGKLPATYSKSDAKFYPEENGYRKTLLDLTGTKYFLDKRDTDYGTWDPEPQNFPGDRVKLDWQHTKFKTYSRTTALNRIFLVGDYLVETDPNAIISRLHDPNFSLHLTLILEEPVVGDYSFAPPGEGSVTLHQYSPNHLSLTTNSLTDSLLFLSDAHYPGWVATVDNQPTPIYRANYAFRAIPVPSGRHQVTFSYRPYSFQRGLGISLFTLIILSTTLYWNIQTRRLDL